MVKDDNLTFLQGGGKGGWEKGGELMETLPKVGSGKDRFMIYGIIYPLTTYDNITYKYICTHIDFCMVQQC